MQRILIIGSAGAGKSTLAPKIAEILQLDLIHLDAYYWKPGWVEPTREEWHQTIDHLLQRERWVMDGNYKSSLPQRLLAADTVIFLDFSRWWCLWGVINRTVRHIGRTRPDMAEGCPERFDWEFLRYVWNFPERSRPVVLDLLNYASETKTVIVLRSPKDITVFLETLQTSPTRLPIH